MIAIIDYGMGNIQSVQKALERMGAQTKVTRNPQDIRRSDKVVLPGVGAFDDAMLELEKEGLVTAINECIVGRKPFLGICLGMQLLFETSQEARQTKGLNILKGTVKRFLDKPGLKIPHMGWNQLKIKNSCALLKGISDNSYVYFCHSYYPAPQEQGVIAATCDYGSEFAAVVCHGNLYGVQFHPEKSHAAGLKILENFVKLC